MAQIHCPCGVAYPAAALDGSARRSCPVCGTPAGAARKNPTAATPVDDASVGDAPAASPAPAATGSVQPPKPKSAAGMAEAIHGGLLLLLSIVATLVLSYFGPLGYLGAFALLTASVVYLAGGLLHWLADVRI